MTVEDGYRAKSRVVPAPNIGGRCRERTVDTHDRFGYDVTTYFDLLSFPNGKQVTVSRGNPFKQSLKSASKGDVGSDFFTSLDELEPVRHNSFQQTKLERSDGSKVTYEYKGPVLPFPPSAYGPSSTPTHSSHDELDEYGATAVAQCKPTNSVADAATLLGELFHDGIPSLPGVQTWQGRADRAKSAGSEYLNTEFGWLPLVSDVRKLSSAVQNASNVLKQYERDAGKVVRRQYRFPMEIEKGSLELGRGYPYGPVNPVWRSDTPSGGAMRRLRQETERHRWFSGAFTYHLPHGYDSRDKMDKYALYADKVLGLNLDPNVLWELAPWSWAVDWFSNAGDVISNITDYVSDGLVMQYGYVMETTITKYIYSMDSLNLEGGGKAIVSDVTWTTTVKQRRKANPFGFGVNWEDLSLRQNAILAALGLSRK